MLAMNRTQAGRETTKALQWKIQLLYERPNTKSHMCFDGVEETGSWKILIFINRDCISMIWKPYLLNNRPYILHVNLLYASTISLSFVWLVFFFFFATLTVCIGNQHTQQKTSSAQCFQTTSQTIYMLVCHLKNHMEIGVSESVPLCHSLFQV